MFGLLEGGGWYTGNVFLFIVFFDQVSYINYFHRSYGLKDIEFQSLNHFKLIFENSFIIKLNIIHNSNIDCSNLTSGPGLS